ncbi:MAG: histidine kinase [Verrucomicrobia bacterium]|nr:histidine kinase [Verrucomicrobiota bacterium]
MRILTDVPHHGRGLSIAIIVGLVGLIGVIDYSTGPRLSLDLFYLIPISLSVAWLTWRAGGVVSIMSILVRVAGDMMSGPYLYPRTAFWNRLVDLLMYFAFVWGLDALINLQRRLEQRVKERTAELVNAAANRRQLEHELLMVGARERNLFGQELHDDICQHLVGTALAAKVLTQHLSTQDPPAAAKAQTIVGLIETGADRTRRLARGLLLSAIEPEKFAESLAELAAENSTASLSCRFRHEGTTLIPDAGIAAQLFRIAQEAVRNALKHADAQHIEIVLAGNPEAITLTVEDDGGGLPPAESRGEGMGLRIMSHRAALVGASLVIEPRNGRGTRVVCRLPLPVAV